MSALGELDQAAYEMTMNNQVPFENQVYMQKVEVDSVTFQPMETKIVVHEKVAKHYEQLLGFTFLGYVKAMEANASVNDFNVVDNLKNEKRSQNRGIFGCCC